MTEHLSSLAALALVQVSLYQVNTRDALQSSWFLVLFYFFIFCFVFELQIFCSFFSISFYEIPLFVLILFIVFGRGIKNFMRFKKLHSQVPDFYLLSGLWMGLLWFSAFSHVNFLGVLALSLFATFFFLVLVGIKERLEVLDTPFEFRGLPILLISVGILLLGFVFLIRFRN